MSSEEEKRMQEKYIRRIWEARKKYIRDEYEKQEKNRKSQDEYER